MLLFCVFLKVIYACEREPSTLRATQQEGVSYPKAIVYPCWRCICYSTMEYCKTYCENWDFHLKSCSSFLEGHQQDSTLLLSRERPQAPQHSLLFYPGKSLMDCQASQALRWAAAWKGEPHLPTLPGFLTPVLWLSASTPFPLPVEPKNK